MAEETTNAQIDTLILDNRKKLNAIIGAPFSLTRVSVTHTDVVCRFHSPGLRAEGR